MSHLDQILKQAISHHQAGRIEDAETLYRQVLAASPEQDHAVHLLGLLLHQRGRSDEGIELIRRAIQLNPRVAMYHLNLGSVLAQQGRAQEALETTRRALELSPGDAQGYFNLGTLLDTLERFEESAKAYRQAVALRPEFAAAYNNLGIALRALGRFEEAEEAYRQSLRLRPGDAKTIKNLGRVLHDQGRLSEAAEQYQAVIASSPTDAEAHNNLGTVLAAGRRLDEAIDSYQQALALKTDDTTAMTNLGNALKESGRLDEALALFRRALDAGGDVRTGNCLMLAIHLHPDYDPARIAEEHRRWEQRFAKPLAPVGNSFANDPDPDRRLRIGYISPQFGDQIVGHCVLPLLANHDHKQFEIVCYSDTRRPDWMTEKLRATADLWRETAGLSDGRLSALIRQDKIDILVDLTMHMERNRLLAFARKPAPVQVTWIGYPSTTGLRTIDYRLSDPYLDPPGTVRGDGQDEQFYSERTRLLPDSYWCYQPLDGLPPPNTLPALQKGFITFGCLNSFVKVNEQTLELWAKVLRRVEHSRLVLLAPGGRPRRWVVDTLESFGVDTARVGFLDRQPRRQYMELYHQIDLGLDTVPYNGHTTMLDSLWMGVPVVSLTGTTAVSRGGLSILSNVGMPELCARTPEQFAEMAAGLAANLEGLSELRSMVRGQMLRSPLMDAPGFARAMENRYRDAWREWSNSAAVAPRSVSIASLSKPRNPAFHIMIVEHSGTPEVSGFYELSRLLQFSLESLGYQASVALNTTHPGATNIVLGYHLLKRPVEGDWIAFQLEQLTIPARQTEWWLEILSHAPQVWDYDPANIEFLQARGVRTPTHVPIGFHEGMRTIRGRRCDIDVLHYGQMSERRRSVLSSLSRHCRVVELSGTHGNERDELIARSKLVLNIHRFEAPVLEQVRLSYLLNNGCCVVSEDSPYNPYRDMMASVKYDEIIERCLSLLSNDQERRQIASEGAGKFEAMPMTDILAIALRTTTQQ